MTTCGSCGASGQPEGARFCFSCGTTLAAPTCVGCAAPILPGARFCSECGAEQSGAATPVQQPVASRRITSVLFGDLVGFTALSESRDQEQVRELLSRYFDECRAVVARYGGTVEKFIGDAVMAVWGVPTAHEDDAERTVRAGLELVNAMEAMGADIGVPDLAMRVGIVTGEVAVTVGAEQQGMVAGDAVNTASRVQSVAAPGQVWVDETTRLLTASAISYVDVGSHPLKGKADPVPLWAVRAVVAAVGGAQRADGLEAPLVGRDREVRLVKELFHGVEETGRPALLVVDGEAGVGKTRLAWEFEKYVDGLTSEVRWHAGRCLSYGEGVAYYALAEAVRRRLEVVADNLGHPGDLDQAAQLDTGLAWLVEDADERDWLQPRLAALLGIGALGSFPREDLFAAWTTFLQRVSESDPAGPVPVVLLVDDAQYADDGLLAFVEHLLGVGTFPCFVMLLTRPGLIEENPHLATNRRATVAHLDVLPHREMAALLDALVAGLNDPIRDSLVSRAEGVPLFAVETVRSLIDRDLVVPRGGQYVLVADAPLDLDEVGAPVSMHALVAARLDTLRPEQRRVLDQASVLGRSFDRDAIAALCPDVPDVDQVLTALVRMQLLRQDTNRFSADVGLYQFVQEVVRQVAYGMIARRDRKAAHLAVVAQLTPDGEPADDLAPIVARHLLEAIDAVPEDPDVPGLTARALALLERAATRARALGAPGDAAAHLRIAFGRAGDAAERTGLELGLAQALALSGQIAPAMEHATSARDAFDELGDELRAAQAVAVLGHCAVVGHLDHEAGLAMCEERYRALRGRPDASTVLLELLRPLVQLTLRANRDFREYVEDKARLADLIGDDKEISSAYGYLGALHSTSGMRSVSRVLFQAAADLARQAHDPLVLSGILVNLSAAWLGDDAARAAESGVEAVSVGQQTGVVYVRSAAAVNLSMAQLLTGDWDAALATAAEIVNDPAVADLVRAEIHTARGQEWEPAAATVRLFDADPDSGDVALWAFAQLARARSGRLDEQAAAALARSAVEVTYRGSSLYDDFSIQFQVATDLAWSAGARSDLDGLLAIVDTHRDGPIPTGVQAQQARVQGLLAAQDGDLAGAEAHLRRAVAHAEQWRSAPIRALIQADLAMVLRRAGRGEEATPLVEEAEAVFERLGATTWAARTVEATA